MAIIIDEILGELIGAALEDKFPSLKETTDEAEAIENPTPSMAGITGGSALAIALREVIKRSKGARGGDKAAENIAAKVATELGVEDRFEELKELSKRAMSSEEAADLLSETLETRLNPKDFQAVKETPKGRDVKAMQDFILEQSKKEAGAAKRSSAKKASRFKEMGEQLAREAELEPELPPLTKTSGTSAAREAISEKGLSTSIGGALDPDTGLRGQTLGAGKSARSAVDDIVDADIVKQKGIGFDRGREGIADAIDEFAKSQDFKKAKGAGKEAGEGIFGKDFIKKIPKKYRWLAGIGAAIGAWKLASDAGKKAPLDIGFEPVRDTEALAAGMEELVNMATGTGRGERERKNLQRRQALEIMNKELAKEFGSK